MCRFDSVVEWSSTHCTSNIPLKVLFCSYENSGILGLWHHKYWGSICSLICLSDSELCLSSPHQGTLSVQFSIRMYCMIYLLGLGYTSVWLQGSKILEPSTQRVYYYSRAVVFNWGQFSSPRGHMTMSVDILVVASSGVLLASSGRRPGMLLSVLHCTDTHLPPTKN